MSSAHKLIYAMGIHEYTVSLCSGYVVRSTKHDKRLHQGVENGFANNCANPSPLIVYAILVECTFRRDFLQNTKNISKI